MMFVPLDDASNRDFFRDEIILEVLRFKPRIWLINDVLTEIFFCSS